MIEDLWYKNAVIYSLDLETFMDANGDGVGDFEGLVRQLDYLHSLGVDAIWLAPFQPTPNKDNGYDISDYYGVDPRHGSSGDFVEFMHQAKRRGIRVLIDLVLNHTSDQHRWFQDARRNKKSPYRDWYVWNKQKPKNWNEGMVFPGVQEATWTLDKEAKEYYFHRFYEYQPDLNTNNPEVRIEMRRVMGYWLQLGVDGFRLDAVPFILETPGVEDGEAKMETKFEYLTEMRKFLNWRRGDAILLGEANVLPDESREYFGQDENGIHMMFNFYVNQYLFYALATGEVEPLVKALRATNNIPAASQWAQFLRNHDELDLGRLTEEQRQKVFARFGPDKKMQLYERGIRRRLGPMLKDRRQIEMANSLMFALPGTPVLRYGDEIGMGDDLTLPEREAIRTPMQWANLPQGGFSTTTKTIHPVINKGEYGYQHINVESQRRDPGSLLNWTARMIRLRKECPEIGWGKWAVIDTTSPHVLALCYDWRGNCLVVIHNFIDKVQSIKLKLDMEGGKQLTNLLVEEECKTDKEGNHLLRLEPYGYHWYRVGSLDYLLHRRKE